MGRYSNTKLAHGTQGSPQITIDENIYKMRILENAMQLNLHDEQNNSSITSGIYVKKEIMHKNILDKIIELICTLGYEPIMIGNIEMYKKDSVIIKVTYIYEYDYYILEKTNDIFSAEKNSFELLASISNKKSQNIILKIVKEILNKF